MLKKIIFFSSTLLTLSAFANDKQEKSSTIINFENPCLNIKKEGILPSGRPCISNLCESKKSGLITNLDFIYFQPKEDSFNFVAKNKDSSLSTGSSVINLNATTYSFDFSYAPGFKFALGFYIPKTSWDTIFNWTQLYSKSTNQHHQKINNHAGLIPLFWDPAAFDNSDNVIRFSDSKSKIDFYFNSLDFEMGNSFFTSPYLSLKIHGGLRGAVIHQKFSAFYENGNTILSTNDHDINLLTGLTKIRSDAKGLGPRIGIDSLFNIYKSNFKIIANSSFAFLLTRFNIYHHEFDTAFDATDSNNMVYSMKVHEYIWVVRPNAQLKLGLSWGKCFGNYFLGFDTGYEINYFWEQNLTRQLINQQVVGITYPSKGDLFLHGFNLAMHLEF